MRDARLLRSDATRHSGGLSNATDQSVQDEGGRKLEVGWNDEDDSMKVDSDSFQVSREKYSQGEEGCQNSDADVSRVASFAS